MRILRHSRVWRLLAVASLLLAGLTIVPVAQAQRGGGAPAAPEIRTISEVCVNQFTGVVRVVDAATICQGHEDRLTFPDDLPATFCVNPFTSVVSYASRGTCPGTLTTLELPGDGDPLFCIFDSQKVIRLVSSPAECTTNVLDFISSFANPDAYAALGNVMIDVPAADGVLANDAPGVTLTSADATSVNGGDVAVNLADGSFTYNPPAGFEGADTFSYSVAGPDGPDSTTVTITVGQVIWFIDNEAAAGGDGRFGTPLDNLAAVNNDGADPDEPGDIIFLYSTLTNYTGGLVLEENQKFIGQCVVDLAETANLTVPPFSAPLPGYICTLLLENAAGNGVDLAPGTLVAGINVTNTLGHGFAGADFSGDVEIRKSVNYPTVGGNGVNLINIDGDVSIVESVMEGHDATAEEPGGDGVYAENVALLNIASSTLLGGDGGSSATSGVDAGDGGAGVRLITTDMVVTDIAMIGGNGGDQTPLGVGGSGGDGIFADETSTVDVTESDALGGNGGSAQNGIAGTGGSGLFLLDDGSADVAVSRFVGGDGAQVADGIAGSGGWGIFARGADSVTVTGSSAIVGGPGAAATSGIAGNGGDGIGGFETASISVSSSTLVGVDGADSGDSFAGDGGSGIFSRSTPVSVSESTLVGADGGVTGGTTGPGSGGRGLFAVMQSASGTAIIDARDNTLYGEGGEASLQVVAFDSSVCLNAAGNSDFTGGPPVGAFSLTGSNDDVTLSITQASLAQLSAANNNVTVDATTQIGFGCSVG